MADIDAYGWDTIEEPEELDIFDALVQVGGDFPPRYAEGDLVVTPRLRSKLLPGELELHEGGLEKKLRFYAWSMVGSWGTGVVDSEALVQDALLERLEDPRELPTRDTERFAIQSIRWAATKLYRKAERIEGTPVEELDPEGADFVPQTLSEGSWVWVQYHLSKKAAEAVRLVLEEQYTQEEAARKVKITTRTVERAFAKLREEAAASL